MKKMRIKLSKREVLLVSVLAVAVLTYLYLTYLIFPGYTRIAELETELMMKKKVAVDRDEARKKLDILDKALEKSRLELEEMERKIPYNVRLPELLVNIDSSIAFLGMEIKSISIGEPDTANKEYDIVPINVSMLGKYDNIIEFIKYIEGNERKFIIDSFGIAPLKRGEAIPFDIAMRTFVLKEPLGAEIPEPTDYNFFRHQNGKSYPFLENNKKIIETTNDIDKELDELEKKQEKLDDLLNRFEGMIPNVDESKEGNQ